MKKEVLKETFETFNFSSQDSSFLSKNEHLQIKMSAFIEGCCSVTSASLRDSFQNISSCLNKIS